MPDVSVWRGDSWRRLQDDAEVDRDRVRSSAVPVDDTGAMHRAIERAIEAVDEALARPLPIRGRAVRWFVDDWFRYELVGDVVRVLSLDGSRHVWSFPAADLPEGRWS